MRREEAPRPRVAVVGAGISGLSCAEWLLDHAAVTVLEAGPRAGGNVGTELVEGRVFERAANGFLDSEPLMMAMVDRVGLADELLPATHGTRYVYLNGELKPIPTKPPAFIMSDLLTWGAKLRVLAEPWMPRGPQDETIADFVRRRLGRQPLERLVGPMVSGVFAGDPERLSLPACFKKMKAMEDEHGSLIRAARARKADPSAAAGPPGHLHSFRGGMGTLLARLAERQPDLRLETPCTRLERAGEGWRVHTPGEVLEVDAVVLACPAPTAASLTASLDADLAEALGATPYAPIAVVVAAFPAAGWTPPEGFGALIPRGQGLRILGTLFTSSIFPAHAAEGEVVLRTMIGGATDPGAAELDPQELLAIALEENVRLLSRGLPAPTAWRVYRWPRGIPQYTLGHLSRVARVRGACGRLPGLFVTGNHLDGVGVKDCAAAGAKVAAQVLGREVAELTGAV